MLAKAKKATDPARFQGNGISYRAKVIGIEDVPEPRGDKMCQEAIFKLKAAVRTSGQHKQKIFVNVTLDGLRIIDATTMIIQHTHPVHQISFISRDITDSRAFGYIFGPGDGTHKFFGIKTANAAESLVLTLRDLFQTVYEMKKKEIEEAKSKVAASEEKSEASSGPETDTTYQVPPNGAPVEGSESIYQVPKNNAPVNPEPEEVVANLLDLEDQADHILKGIEQIKNLDFDELRAEEQASPKISSSSTTDPWGLSTPAVSAGAVPGSSSLSDLGQLQNPLPRPPGGLGAFGGMPAFPSAPVPGVGIPAAGSPFGLPQPGGLTMPGQQMMMGPAAGLPISRDPFGDDLFGTQASQPMQTPVAMPLGPQPGFSMGNPFAVGPRPGFSGLHQAMPALPPYGMPGSMPGVMPFGMASPLGFGPMAGTAARLGAPASDPFLAGSSVMQPIRPASQIEEEQPPAPAPKRPGLFEDLVDIKGSSPATKTPKDLFKDLNAPPRKSMNAMKSDGSQSATSNASKASDSMEEAFSVDPFGTLDAVLHSAASEEDDPFDSYNTLPPSAPPPPLPHVASPRPPPAPPDRIICAEGGEGVNHAAGDHLKESSPEDRFDMPVEPPPPLPSHLQFQAFAPPPPPRLPPREPHVPRRPVPKQRKSSSSSASIESAAFSAHALSSTSQNPSVNTLFASVDLSTSNATLPTVHSDNCHSPTKDSFQIPNASPVAAQDSTLSQTAEQHNVISKMVGSMADDPFGVPLRLRKGHSSADGAKRSSQTSSSQCTVAVDPFGFPLSDEMNKSQSKDSSTLFSSHSDLRISATSQNKWEHFGETEVDIISNGVKTLDVKHSSVSSSGRDLEASPFTDSFLIPTPGSVNGEAQS